MDAEIYGGVAQLGEHLPCKQGVKSSNLSISTRSGNWSKVKKKANALKKVIVNDLELRAYGTQSRESIACFLENKKSNMLMSTSAQRSMDFSFCKVMNTICSLKIKYRNVKH